jgi:large repetitive protein
VVTVYATDAAGNVAKATFTVTVRDTTPPTLTVTNQTVQATGPNGARVTFTGNSATDNSGFVTITYSIPSGSAFGFGTTTVTATATDAFGNKTVKTFTVTVVDTTPPTITSVSKNLTIEATSRVGAVVNYLPASVFDAVGVTSVTYSQASGSTFAIGTTTVTVKAMDAAGNILTKTFTITVRDTTPPKFTSVPANITVKRTTDRGATVTYPVAVATDAVGVASLTYSLPSGSVFPVGRTTVVLTAKDAAGNASTATFTVTVL